MFSPFQKHVRLTPSQLATEFFMFESRHLDLKRFIHQFDVAIDKLARVLRII